MSTSACMWLEMSCEIRTVWFVEYDSPVPIVRVAVPLLAMVRLVELVVW